MEDLWEETCNHFRDLAAKPEKFLDPKSCEGHFEKAKVVAKVFYDAAKLAEDKDEGLALQTLPELIIEDFDAEQVIYT